MTTFTRSAVTTKSERHLAKLADRTFLDLWSYPNVYRPTIVKGVIAGNEVSDLLVVRGAHVLARRQDHRYRFRVLRKVGFAAHR